MICKINAKASLKSTCTPGICPHCGEQYTQKEYIQVTGAFQQDTGTRLHGKQYTTLHPLLRLVIKKNIRVVPYFQCLTCGHIWKGEKYYD